jgi:methyl-accepting chemotaxis protein
MAHDQHPKGGPGPADHPGNGGSGGANGGPPGGPGDVTDTQLHAFAIDRLSQAFETSAKRWELIVYPSLFAFIILAAYGFYLVFSLAKDVHYLAISVDSNMTVMASNLQSMSDNVGQMSANMRSMAIGVDSISRDVSTLEPMLTSMQNMDRAVQNMTANTTYMRDDMSTMNRTIGRPMSFINWFMPW